MSLKSFHLVFILISSLFMAYFSYWSISGWINYKDLSYIFYAFLAFCSFFALVVYYRKFSKKFKEITS